MPILHEQITGIKNFAIALIAEIEILLFDSEIPLKK